MTRPLNLAHPVRCAKCGAKFVRKHGRESLCLACKRPDVRARNAARSASAKAESADWLNRESDAMSLRMLLRAGCPHGNIVGKCRESWCRNRVEDFGG
jgi:hypothetical protein